MVRRADKTIEVACLLKINGQGKSDQVPGRTTTNELAAPSASV
jgi:hypothetical protein